VAWVKLDDGFAEHPKVLAISDAAFRLYIVGLCYANRHLTDGRLPHLWLTGGRGRSVPKAAHQLVAAGLWEHDDLGYCIHDYLQHQTCREDVNSYITARREAGRRGGIASGEARRETKQNEANAKQVLQANPKQVLEAKTNQEEEPNRRRAATPLIRPRNLNAAYEHPRFDVPQVWHDKRVDAISDGEFGMSSFYKHLAAHIEANPDEDTEPRFEWLTGHFNTWVRARQKPAATASDVPDVAETKRRYLSTR
jgi:hypothetical protein